MSWRKTLAVDKSTVEFRIVWRASRAVSVVGFGRPQMNGLAPDDQPGDSDVQRELAASRRAAVHARELAERASRIVDAISGRDVVLPEASAGGDPVGN